MCMLQEAERLVDECLSRESPTNLIPSHSEKADNPWLYSVVSEVTQEAPKRGARATFELQKMF